jgi:tetratricopeptide (TPR) repeat protein
MVARHDQSVDLSETLLAKAQLLHDPTTLAVGHRAVGSTLFTRGDFLRAREHLEQAIAVAPRASIERISLSYAVDPRIASLLMLGWDQWILGYPDQALGNALRALEEAMESADPYAEAFAHYVTSAVRLLRGEFRQSLCHADSSFAISLENRISLYELYARFGRGCALAGMGQPGQAIAEIERGIKEAQRCNLAYMSGFMLGWLATVQAEAGSPELALLTIDEALRGTNEISGRAWEAELYRVRGNCMLTARPDAADEVASNYRVAIAVAQRQGSHSLELRAAISLARLLQRRGGSEDARAVLSPAYGWFTEGFDTADLRDAKTVLSPYSIVGPAEK